MSEFTKGKWEYKQGDGNYWTIQSVKAEQVGDCINEANARLIAAAPEMYEMLDTISYLWNSGAIIDNTGTIRRAQELIARIDGEEE